MVIKDVFCSECGREMEAYLEPYERETEDYCPLCGDTQIFYSKCTGGTKSRWRYIDWDGYDGKGAMVTESSSVTHTVDGKEEPLPHKYYGTVDNYEQQRGPERDDRFEFNYKKKRGKTPLMFDTKPKV